MTASQMIRNAIAKECPGYQGELRNGAVYQSKLDSNIRRRIQSIHDEVVSYVFVDRRRTDPVRPTCFMLEEMFRSVTGREIPPEELDSRSEAAKAYDEALQEWGRIDQRNPDSIQPPLEDQP